METEEKGQAIASPFAQSEGDLVIRQAHSSYDWALFPLRVMIFFKLCEGKVIDKPWLKTIIKDSKDINIIVLCQGKIFRQFLFIPISKDHISYN